MKKFRLDKKSLLPYILIFFLASLSFTGNASAASAVINGKTTYQEIIGFEVTGLGFMDHPSKFGMPLEGICKQLKDFGFKVIKIRQNLDEFEPSNDNSYPLSFNWEYYESVFKKAKFVEYFKNVKLCYDSGLEITLSAFQPPSWMRERRFKYRRYKLDSDYPRPQLYQEIAELWAAYVKHLKDSYDVNVSSILIWNEPVYGEPLTFTTAEVVETLKAIGSRFAVEGLKTKIMIPDSANIIPNTLDITHAILNDPLAAKYASGIAYHTYDYNEQARPDRLISVLKKLAADSQIASSGLPLLNTEWAAKGKQGNLKSQTLVWAKHIHNNIVYGRSSLVDLWYVGPLPWSSDVTAVLENDGQGGTKWRKHVHAFEQYAKYITPGSKRIAASISGAPGLFITAYMHRDTGKFTIVTINRGVSSRRVSFKINNIQGLSSLDVIRTSASESSTYLGGVPVNGDSFSYGIPQESITTFTGNAAAMPAQ